MNNFFQRLITGTIFVSVMLGAVVFGPVSFILLFSVITFLGVWEFLSLASKDTLVPQKILGALTGTALFLISSLGAFGQIDFAYLYLIIPLMFVIFISELFAGKEKPFYNIAFSLLGIIYVALPMSLLPLISFKSGAYSSHILLGILFLLWSSDTGAYLFGVKFGKHRLFEKVSPKKSWEGSLGGTCCALLVAYLMAGYFSELSVSSWVILALIIVVFGTLGDLIESLFKRSIHVKDSGTILPGHGGILDRFDGLIFAVPFIFVYLFFIVNYF